MFLRKGNKSFTFTTQNSLPSVMVFSYASFSDKNLPTIITIKDLQCHIENLTKVVSSYDMNEIRRIVLMEIILCKF